MHKPTDEELIEEIRQRFEFNRNALEDLRALTRKLEIMNDKLKDSEALKSHFLSNIRNEINNPLSAIMGLASQFFTGRCDPAVCRNNARMIYSEAFNLDFQLQNIFMAAELEAGDVEPAHARVDIAPVIDSCIDKLAYRAEEKQIEVSRSCPDELVFTSDARMLEMILINLLANGVEFNNVGGQLSVEAEQSDDRLRITVSDNGPGIAPADQELIFDRFRQLQSGTTKPHRGHGLGLSICWSLAELLQGTLDVDSRPQQGSRFVLTLPRPAVDATGYAKDANFFLFEQDEETERF
ncbi:MAG: HAMP domain-containing sensor histidine kinase [Desulfuromonadales bacterium]|nr:HAMP domain-containing sensor histidine kinase [Desulfuromonadales bacterium]